jgi:transcriptional regulator with XRE-family HTH domain
MQKSERFSSDWSAFCSHHGGFPRWVDFKTLESGEEILKTLKENSDWPHSVRRLLVSRLLEKGSPYEWVQAATHDPEVAYPALLPAILKQGSSGDWLNLSMWGNPPPLDYHRFAERFAAQGEVEDLLTFVYGCQQSEIPLTDVEQEMLRNRAGQLGGSRGLARYDLIREGIFWPFQAHGRVGFPGALMPWSDRLDQLQETEFAKRLDYLGFEPAIGITGLLAALDRRLSLESDAERARALGIPKRRLRAWIRGLREPDNRELLHIGQLLGVHDSSMATLLKAIQHRYGWHSWHPLARALSVSPRTIERWARGRAKPPAKLIPALLFIAESNRVTFLFIKKWTEHRPEYREQD